jgi:hypothetical protein
MIVSARLAKRRARLQSRTKPTVIYLEITMAIVPTLLTPLILSVTPATINVPTAQYNHATQGAEVVAQYSRCPYNTTTSTGGGTQTFDVNGRPRDADNDQGCD